MKKIACFYFTLFFSTITNAAPFDIDSDIALLFASESITNSDLELDGKVRISAASDELNLQFKAGFAISQSSRYVRIEFVNGSLLNNLPTTGLASDINFSSFLVQGGTIGDSFAIIELYAATSQPQNTALLLEVTDLKILDRSLPIKVNYSLYGNPSDAVNAGPKLYSKEVEMLRFVSGLATGYADSHTLSLGFGTEFLRFNPTFRAPSTFSLGDSNGDLGSLAKFTGDFLIIENVRRPSDSAKINDFRDLLVGFDTSANIASLSGDFSSGDVSLNSNDDCTGANYPLITADFSKSIAISLDTLFNYPVLCIDLTGNTSAFSRTEFQLDLGLGQKSVFFGKVSYDGSSVDFPFLTSYSNFRQKIFITNHAGYDIAYKFEFFAEEDVKNNFQLGSAVNGTLKASGVTKIDVWDLFTVNDNTPTRLSGRMLIDGLPQDISAAIQLVSLTSSTPPTTNVLAVKQN